MMPSHCARRLGSSPRVRGKHRRGHPRLRAHRLIPACAGKTPRCAGACCWGAAHPRVCGENSTTTARASRRRGSSPRVRGKPVDGGPLGGGCRLIPACAGKTAPSSSTPAATSAHPRVCGENWANAGKELPFEGSSPRVRGKQGIEDGHRRRVRLIPACAGKTDGTATASAPTRAHPRVCGENRRWRRGWRPRWGSSPRVRGKRRYG